MPDIHLIEGPFGAGKSTSAGKLALELVLKARVTKLVDVRG